MKKLLLLLMVVVVYALHQDFWNWKQYEPLVFGFVPIGLAYQAGYSILAAIMMAVLVKCAWPSHLEQTESQQPDSNHGAAPGERGQSGSKRNVTPRSPSAATGTES